MGNVVYIAQQDCQKMLALLKRWFEIEIPIDPKMMHSAQMKKLVVLMDDTKILLKDVD